MEKIPKFYQFSHEEQYCEKSNSKPIETLIPNQAIKLSELVSRFERGQRLNVHENFTPMSNFTNGNYVYEEDFDDAPPDDIHDVVDVHAAYQEHQERVSNFKSKHNKTNTADSPSQDGKQPKPSANAPDSEDDPAK